MIAVLAGIAGSSLAVAIAVIVLRRGVVVVSVSGPSMAPTLRHGDRVLVRRTPRETIGRGDIVVVTEPGPCRSGGSDGSSHSTWVIKRVVAVPGDAEPAFLPDWARRPDGFIGPGRLVVLGDNPDFSWDSRQFGTVQAEQVLGVVIRPLVGKRPPPPRGRSA
ncbi:signal peptidase I [Nonomuraea indica]|uniref:Signal peptidase I n=1 Tax=Nonomuraea indica TaxID=1581193 RepID=A0ABW8A8E3_9ACTN